MGTAQARTRRQGGVHYPLALITILRSPDRALRRPSWQARRLGEYRATAVTSGHHAARLALQGRANRAPITRGCLLCRPCRWAHRYQPVLGCGLWHVTAYPLGLPRWAEAPEVQLGCWCARRGHESDSKSEVAARSSQAPVRTAILGCDTPGRLVRTGGGLSFGDTARSAGCSLERMRGHWLRRTALHRRTGRSPPRPAAPARPIVMACAPAAPGLVASRAPSSASTGRCGRQAAGIPSTPPSATAHPARPTARTSASTAGSGTRCPSNGRRHRSCRTVQSAAVARRAGRHDATRRFRGGRCVSASWWIPVLPSAGGSGGLLGGKPTEPGHRQRLADEHRAAQRETPIQA